jgi:tRNA-specific 2-thiouridylase
MDTMSDLGPKKGARIVVAMSGGVDSSVAAGWLKRRGYDVIGISLQLHDLASTAENKFGTCCSLTDIGDARRVAEKLDIPFYVAKMENEFNAAVIDDFVHEYLNGRTPNPCVRCNEKVKFSRLMDWAMDLGADFLATGHYANVRYNPENHEHELAKGKDGDKDQSYFLFTMRQNDLARTLFPIGGFEKKQVRELARELGLLVADKPDSQEICFVQSRNYKDFIEETVPRGVLKPGNIVNTDGTVLGAHTGLHQFTIGQRKGLGVHSQEPLFVLKMDSASNEVVVGAEEFLYKNSCTVSNLNWINPPELDKNQNFQAKIRYRSKESPVLLKPLLDNRVEVNFAEPQRAITPGQAMVFYKNDQVVGGGWIEDLGL